jgi:pentatricopeptide repeat protein
MRIKRLWFCGLAFFAAVILSAYAQDEPLATNETVISAPADEPAAPAAPAEQPKTLRQIAEGFLAEGNKEEAKAALREVIAAKEGADADKPWAVRAFYQLAEEKGGIDEGIKYLEEKGKKDYTNKGLYGAVADGYIKMGNWGGAADMYEKMLKASPQDGYLQTRLIDIYRMTANYVGIINLLEPQVRTGVIGDGDSDILANAYLGAGENKKSLDLYKLKWQRHPTPGLAGRYAQALQDAGEDAQAVEVWKEAVKMDPSSIQFKEKMAGLYELRGEKKEARQVYEQMLAQLPEGQADARKRVEDKITAIDRS